MKQEDWQAAYGPIPDALSSRVSSTLLQVAIEYRAPEGTYLYSDLVPMTEQEWEMSTLDYLNAYGPYYRLLDANVQFVKASETQPISTEIMMDGQRIAPNIIREQIYFSVWEKSIQQVQFDLSAMFISSEDESTDITYTGVFTPNYAPDTAAPQCVHLTFDPATNACALASMDVTFTELVTIFSAQLENNADAIYLMQVYDANGSQLCYTSLSSLIGESYQNSVIKSYDAMIEIPDVLYVQFYQLDPDTGTQTTVGEPITLSLK